MNREVGALISLQPNASKIVDSWNIKPFLKKSKPMIDRAFRIMDTAGQIQTEIPIDTTKFGASRMCYHRQDLHAALREAAVSNTLPGRAAEILTSSAVASCDCEAGTVTLEDGSVFHGDVIIGADGIHSVIRKEILRGTSAEGIEPLPTGLSAYRILVETSKLRNLGVSATTFDPANSVTTMIMGRDRRIIMGPGRGGEMLGLVGMVPDGKMNEDSSTKSWTSEGSVEELSKMYEDFPVWLGKIFEQAPDIALWQLRDIDPLPTWIKGRAIIIGDAAHAMLPTQGQGASQSIEDAEALQAIFRDFDQRPSREQISEGLALVFAARYQRVTLIQMYSRQQARPATSQGSKMITLNPGEFMEYNCNYNGALEWLERQKSRSDLVVP